MSYKFPNLSQLVEECQGSKKTVDPLMPKTVSCQRRSVCALLCEQLEVYCLAALKRQYVNIFFWRTVSRTAKMRTVAQGNEGLSCGVDFIQPMLPVDHIEDFLAEFKNIASFKAWPRGRWAELLQPFLPA